MFDKIAKVITTIKNLGERGQTTVQGYSDSRGFYKETRTRE